MRIAIVNDMQMSVEILRRVISSVPEYEIVWIAYDGLEAVEKCMFDTPDLIIMDIMMPRMNGVNAIRQIMKASPCAILVVTATVQGNSAMVFEALGAGALDAVNTPLMDAAGKNEGAELLKKISLLGRLIKVDSTIKRKVKNIVPASTSLINKFTIVAIGSSTGGPNALSAFFSRIPADINAAFVVIQHIDKQFAPGLASWLAGLCKLQVKLAENGDIPEKGKILLAATNDHLVLLPDLTMRYTTVPENNPYRPSVDVFFNSLASHWKLKGIAVQLTGIGRDGAEGLLKLKKMGWTTFAQDQESSVVYGMPKAAAELNAASEILSPGLIAERIVKLT